jgi:glucose/arabinose dehydrogenase
VGTVATGLEAPWGLGFLPDGDAVVTERDTRRVLRVTAGGDVTELGVLEQAVPDNEGGLLGVAVSPDFDSDGLLYFYLTTADDNRVVRAPLRGGRLGRVQVVLDGIPRSTNHDGGRLAFGPDGFLYASTGDALDPASSQDSGSLAGKILRFRPDDPPGDPVYTLGHRNVQGLAFDDSGQLWASEFGQDTWDELNRIEPGLNYGWPLVEGRAGDVEGAGAPSATERFVDPQQVWRTDEASPSGLAFAGGFLWMAALRGERLWRVAVDGGRAVRPRGFFVGEYGRMRTVALAPDGSLWVTTSNRDGRGDPGPDDDRILRVSID